EARAKAERAEQEARAAHARLLEAFAAVPEGLVLFDAENRYVLWNRKYAEVYAETAHLLKVGAKFEDVLRAGVAAGLYEEAAGREDAWIAERLARHRQPHSVHEKRRGDRWLRVEERRTSDGGSIGIRVDITELKQREATFRLLFDGNPLPMYVFDAQTLKFLAVNDAAVAQFGYSREQFLTMTVLDVRPAEDHHLLLSALRAFSGYHMAKGRHYFKADGSMFEADIYAGGLNFEGRPARFAAIVDTTDQRRAERERDRNRQFLDQIIESVPTTIFVKNAHDRRYLLVNQAGEKMWGYTRGTLIGRTAREVYAQEVADDIEAHDNEVVATRRAHTYYDQPAVTPAGGTVVFNVTTIPISDESGEPQYLLTVADDLTERRAVENQLRQAQKMEAVGNLTGGLAHDFNNLLMIIIGNIDLLQEDVASIPAASEKVETILQASLRGADLTRQLLAFSRRQPLQPTRIDVDELLHNTTRLLERTLGEHIAVKLRPTVGLWPVNVDKAQLEAALVNLAINARDAMPGGGTLIIETRNMHVGIAEPSRQPGLLPGDYVVIQVSDSGTGMPPEVLAHIFEPFYTTKGPAKGTGLGLSMVYGFIKQSGGHIAAFSEVGTGTTFKLYLPRAGVAEADIESTGVPSSSPAARGEVILAVDDNPAIRATAVAQLRDLGYQVLEADSAQAALEVLERADKVDLLFTDIVMPGMNGKELATCARAKRRDLRILFTSGFLGAAQPDDAVLDVGDVLLGKPYRKHDLARAVHEVLNGRL
ncbi:MAG TPA: PAS domain S-box protein, partial [Xanthobacteraceae bacterium]